MPIGTIVSVTFYYSVSDCAFTSACIGFFLVFLNYIGFLINSYSYDVERYLWGFKDLLI
jgi:hypothetical protein